VKKSHICQKLELKYDFSVKWIWLQILSWKSLKKFSQFCWTASFKGLVEPTSC